MKRTKFKMTPEMKETLEMRRLSEMIHTALEDDKPKKKLKPNPKARLLYIPEDFTGRDLKRARKYLPLRRTK